MHLSSPHVSAPLLFTLNYMLFVRTRTLAQTKSKSHHQALAWFPFPLLLSPFTNMFLFLSRLVSRRIWSVLQSAISPGQLAGRVHATSLPLFRSDPQRLSFYCREGKKPGGRVSMIFRIGAEPDTS
ncbi:hypothetical protein V8C42DRAFT_115122 [Trichoderma barbatum]